MIDVLLLQKKAVKVVTDSDPLDHCKLLFIKSYIKTVIKLYIYDFTYYALRNKGNYKYCSDNHNYNTRKKYTVCTY